MVVLECSFLKHSQGILWVKVLSYIPLFQVNGIWQILHVKHCFWRLLGRSGLTRQNSGTCKVVNKVKYYYGTHIYPQNTSWN